MFDIIVVANLVRCRLVKLFIIELTILSIIKYQLYLFYLSLLILLTLLRCYLLFLSVETMIYVDSQDQELTMERLLLMDLFTYVEGLMVCHYKYMLHHLCFVSIAFLVTD